MMGRLSNLFRWLYGFQRRHALLLLGVCIGGIHLYVANATSMLHPLLAVAPFLALGAVLYGIVAASRTEQVTIGLWSACLWLGFGGAGYLIHGSLTTQQSFSQFISAHPVGLITGVLMTLGLVLTILTAVITAVSWARDRRGGDRGATPEERVLTKDEYDDFDPIEEMQRCRGDYVLT